VRLGFLAAAAVALLGPWRLQWHDDVRDLQIAAPALQANDQEIRRLFGDSAERTVYLTRGATPSESREALQRFLTWHEETFPQSPAASAGLLLPTQSDWRRRPALLGELASFPTELRAAFERHGYAADGFEPFFGDWQKHASTAAAPPYSTLVDELRTQLKGPLGLLFYVGSSETWFLTLAEHGPEVEPPAALNTVTLSQLETLNSLFSRYRASALRLSVIGLSLVGASVFVLYGFRRGPRIFMIPAGSCFFVFGVLGLLGQTLNLFHLLGAFLGVCLSHNYAIFSAENAGRHEPPPPSIRLSALTAAASFGVLGFSKIAVVAALGSTVAFIVLTALVLVELEPLGREVPQKA
jgi:predicted exporter